jgi:hypothetical protein
MIKAAMVIKGAEGSFLKLSIFMASSSGVMPPVPSQIRNMTPISRRKRQHNRFLPHQRFLGSGYFFHPISP